MGVLSDLLISLPKWKEKAAYVDRVKELMRKAKKKKVRLTLLGTLQS